MSGPGHWGAGHPTAGKSSCSACRDGWLLPEQQQLAGCTAATGGFIQQTQAGCLVPRRLRTWQEGSAIVCRQRLNPSLDAQPIIIPGRRHLQQASQSPGKQRYLAEHVAGWQRHVWQCGRVPGSQHDATVMRVGFYFVDALSQLVHPLPAVVCVHATVGGPEVAPLEAVHWPQVPLLPAVQVCLLSLT